MNKKSLLIQSRILIRDARLHIQKMFENDALPDLDDELMRLALEMKLLEEEIKERVVKM